MERKMRGEGDVPCTDDRPVAYAKEIDIRGGDYWAAVDCPFCKRNSIFEGTNFCSNCGVPVKWIANDDSTFEI